MSNIIDLINKYQEFNTVVTAGHRNYVDKNNQILHTENVYRCPCMFYFQEKEKFKNHYTDKQHLAYLIELTNDGEIKRFYKNLFIREIRERISKYTDASDFLNHITYNMEKYPSIQDIQESKKRALYLDVNAYLDKMNIKKRVTNKLRRERYHKKYSKNKI